MSTHPEFGGLDNATLGALLFELASQLHVERTRRLALEAALQSAGVVTPAAIEKAAEQSQCRERAAMAADQSISKIMRVLSESKDERIPLRAESATSTGDA